MEAFTDIHCHIVPRVDDGAETLDESLAMAQMALSDGISTIIATPHQLGNSTIQGEIIRQRTRELQQQLQDNGIPLKVLAGADVRVEPDLIRRIQSGEVVTLADQRKHVLLELPHELFIPLDFLLKELKTSQIVGILSHPERNQGLLANAKPLFAFVDQGGLLQITADSLLGGFGKKVQSFTEYLLLAGMVHFVATDAHGTNSRRPLLSKAFQRVAELTDEATAFGLCSYNPACIVKGLDVAGGRRSKTSQSWWHTWFRRAA